MSDRCIYITKTLSQTRRYGLAVEKPKTEKGTRVVAIGDGLAEVLRQHKAAQEVKRLYLGDCWQDLNLVCPNDNGGYLEPNNLSRIWWDILRKTKITKHVRLHDLRDTHNSMLLAIGIPGEVRMDRMGWSSPDIMNRVYTHVQPEQQREAARQMDAIIKAAS